MNSSNKNTTTGSATSPRAGAGQPAAQPAPKADGFRPSNEEANRRTREGIQVALLQLMREMPFDKISITELVKRSGVSRMAFYRNFSSKQEVLNDLYERRFHQVISFIDQYEEDGDMVLFYEKFLHLFSDHQEDINTIFHAGLRASVVTDLTHVVPDYYANTSPDQQYQAMCWWGATQSVIVTWYQRGMEESISDMAKLCCAILPPIPTKIK